MKNLSKIFTAALLLATFSSCKKDLNVTATNNITGDQVYATADGYKSVLIKTYASFATTSGNGSGSSDLGGIDAGSSDFIRLYWNAQELSSDEGLCVWGDPGVADMDYSAYTADNIILQGLYTRSLYQITIANLFLRESTPAMLASRNITNPTDVANIAIYGAEARFLRAYQYWVLMDTFGNPPFITETSEIGTTAPKQIKRADLFKYVESELLAVEPMLPVTNDYGRATRGAADMLLSRLYLNAPVYSPGTTKYTESITYANKVINGPYSLEPSYQYLFLGDNNVNNNETILSINYDGAVTQNYGGTTFILNGSISSDMNPASFGVPGGGWVGLHMRSTVSSLMNDPADKRRMLYGTKATNDTLAIFTDGLRVTKWKNITKAGVTVPSVNGTFSSIDFPLFRLPEAYLNLAEAVLRGGTGASMGDAIADVNKLRVRAYGNTNGNVTALTLDDILTERAKEFYWEGYRRTDLIRFGKYTGGSYLWPWKGGTFAGSAIPDTRSIFPLPTADVIANPNLVQNPGY
ncbi:RagB/SusD family nutrient uptake outer membrane protein [Pedobacter sp. L105]|uniref:RagB/SusD family nutrient uptake outer membrane protein n=1 Tax=Pedobacter sp. L105 TaxID=1641871 RepID=UPI00131BEB82|nr:RagB/SusD family nutrient uptake outer membrane protein [Pedobacter sp. L105]